MTLFLGGLLIGLFIGFMFWLGERNYCQMIEKYRERDHRDNIYWLEEYLKLKDELEGEGEEWKDK